MLRVLAVFSLVLLHGLGAVAAESPPPSKSKAQEVAKAFDAGNREALKAAADAYVQDPWLVAFRLVKDKRHDVAAALAKAASWSGSQADLKALHENLDAWKTAKVDAKLIERFDAIERARAGKDWSRVASLAAAFTAQEPTVLRAAVSGWHAEAVYRIIRQREQKGEPKRTREFEDLQSAAKRAAGAAGRIGWLAVETWALYHLGHAQMRLREFEAALESWTGSAARLNRREWRVREASVRANIAGLHIDLGNYAGAVGPLQRSISIFRSWRARDPKARQHLIALSLRNLSYARQLIGEYRAARRDARAARDAAVKSGDADAIAKSLRVLAEVQSELGNHDGALATAKEALKQFQRAGKPHGVGQAHGTMGLVHIELEQYDEAIAAFEAAHRKFVEAGDELQAAKAISEQGRTRVLQGRRSEGLTLLREALVVIKEKRGLIAEFESQFWIAEAHRRRPDLRGALDVYDLAWGLASKIDYREGLIDVCLGRAQAKFALQRYAGAASEAEKGIRLLAESRSGLGQELGALARAPHSRLFQVGVRAAAAHGDAPSFCYFLESGRVGLLETLEAREAFREAAMPLALRHKVEMANIKVAAATTRLRRAQQEGDLKAAVKHRGKLDLAREALADVVEEIQEHVIAAAHLLYPEPASLDEICRHLALDEMAVYYSVLGQKAYAVKATQGSCELVDLGDAQVIGELAVDALQRLSDSQEETDKVLAALRTRIVKPLNIPKKIRRLLVIPGGELHLVPFQAITDEYATMYISSGTLLTFLSKLKLQRGSGVLALGDPSYAKSRGRGRTRLRRLPETRLEVEAIGTRKLLGEGATEAAFRDALKGHERWRSVHLACHGLVNSDRPMMSSLAMTPADGSDSTDDGFLMALEVVQMRIDTDLAVLSACESGRGKIYRVDGLMGLTRAFMLAGVPRLLVSLWRVDDEATRALMVKFYELWNPKDPKKKPLSASEALKEAQVYVRDHEDKKGKRHWEHPYYWAAWVLWGLPD